MRQALGRSDPIHSPGTAVAGPAAACAALFVLAIVVQIVGMNRIVGAYDEGLMLYGAQRVARGDVPYRDFWTMYGPGGFYVTAWLFGLFGESVWVARAFDVVSRAAVVVLIFANLRTAVGGGAALIAALLGLALLVAVQAYAFPIFPALACSLAALYAVACTERAQPDSALGWAVVAGASTALCMLIRHDLGTYTLLAVAASFIAIGPPRDAKAALAFATGLLGVLLPAVAFFVWAVPLSLLYENLILIPLTVYPPFRSLPFPSVAGAIRNSLETMSLKPVAGLIVYLPLIVGAVAAFFIARGQQGGNHLTDSIARFGLPARAMLMLLVMNILFYLKGAVRVEALHLAPALVLSLLLGTLLMQHIPLRLLRVAITMFFIAVAVGRLVEHSRATTLLLPAMRALFDPTSGAHDLPTCAGAALPRLRCFGVDADRVAVLAYLQHYASATDTLYVGVDRHDKIFVNNIELYFLSGLGSVTRWHDLHPGIQTTHAIQQTMIDEMRRHAPDFVVLNAQWDSRQEPNRSAVSSGVTLLDDHLRANFAPVFTAGTLTVLRPAGVASGSAAKR
ncbi:MAG: glycosyltransferase family 39 protein [Proteobacteria bacterium]|nr:glycosyltransferase family 39 protein [Burkholderiales bacterium]